MPEGHRPVYNQPDSYQTQTRKITNNTNNQTSTLSLSVIFLHYVKKTNDQQSWLDL